MLDKIPPEDFFVYVFIGLLGGLARLALGVKEEGVTIKSEIFRLFVVSMPVAIMAGVYAEQQGLGIAVYPITYFSGLAALNIARTAMTQGISGIISAFVRK